jgi:phenylalanyl-tRNA synthetase beta chain
VPLASLRVVAEPPPWYHPGRAAVIRLGPKTVLAAFGELHPRILKMLDLKGPAVGFEVRLDAIPAARGRPAKARPVFKPSPLQPVERDFAFVVDDAVAADRLLRAVAAADKALITAASVFDVYAGEGIAPGRKSIAVTVTLQPVDRTLTEPEIDAVARKIVANVAKETGGVLRA